jgi:peroxiredoxin family protein
MKMTMMGLPTGNLGIEHHGYVARMTAFATSVMHKKIADVGAPPVGEYLQMLVDGGAKLYACKMSVDMMGLKKQDFVDGVLDIVTASDFMDMTEGAQIIFI